MSGFVEVETTAGRLRGIAAPGVAAFLGIPYASAPARFARSSRLAAWSGVRDAFAFGPACPQVDSRVGISPDFYRVQRLLHPGVPTPVEGGYSREECQMLNIWTPSIRDSRPVLVWLHGGGDTQGTGAEGWTQGDLLAQSADVVVVTLNHRLGVLGYLGDEDPAAESGLAGVFDIIEALRWVQENIGAFGGDPGNVTLFGQSGGGGKICTLMAMPAAAGLFHKAILQSGVKVRAVVPEQAQRFRRDLEQELAQQGTQLQTAPLVALVEAQRLVEQRHGGRAIGPVLHPTDLPVHPFADGAPPLADRIAVLMGTTRHDSALRLSTESWYHHLTWRELPERVGALFPEDDPSEVLDYYRQQEEDALPQIVLARACADQATRRVRSDVVRDAKAAQAAAVYTYRLDYQTEVLGGILGAPHCLDVPLVFGNADRSPITGSRSARFHVSQAMVQAWGAFARDGRPSSPNLPIWPAYAGPGGEEMRLDIESRVEVVSPPPSFDSTITAGT